MPTTGTISSLTGLLSMLLLTVVVLLGVTISQHGRLPGLPRFTVLQLHRRLSLLSVAFLTVHVLTAALAPFGGTGLAAIVLPFGSPRSPFWIGLGAVATDLMAALVVTSLLRRHLGWRTWRTVHWLAYGCWGAAMAHSLGTGTQLLAGRLFDLALGCIAAVVVAVVLRVAGALRATPRQRRVPRMMSALDLPLPETGEPAAGHAYPAMTPSGSNPSGTTPAGPDCAGTSWQNQRGSG